MVIASPVMGLRPWRSARSTTLKRPNPASVTSSPALAAAAIAANALSRILLVWSLVRCRVR
jgi:hypothetical protein